MVYVPAGPFLMGSTPDNPEADNVEYPQRDIPVKGRPYGEAATSIAKIVWAGNDCGHLSVASHRSQTVESGGRVSLSV